VLAIAIASSVIVVVWMERPDDTIRIISARIATRDEVERSQYMEEGR
jgi:uncharacterized DUF497 family protein